MMSISSLLEARHCLRLLVHFKETKVYKKSVGMTTFDLDIKQLVTKIRRLSNSLTSNMSTI